MSDQLGDPLPDGTDDHTKMLDWALSRIDRDRLTYEAIFYSLAVNPKDGIHDLAPLSREDKNVLSEPVIFGLREGKRRRLARLADLRAVPYPEYLTSPEWMVTRARMIEKAGRRCRVCNNGDETLDVHHRTYERLGEERDEDLTVLCQDCHRIFHENGKLAR